MRTYLRPSLTDPSNSLSLAVRRPAERGARIRRSLRHERAVGTDDVERLNLVGKIVPVSVLPGRLLVVVAPALSTDEHRVILARLDLERGCRFRARLERSSAPPAKVAARRPTSSPGCAER
jgi:hypothetical protein